jgi:hypothetical protein
MSFIYRRTKEDIEARIAQLDAEYAAEQPRVIQLKHRSLDVIAAEINTINRVYKKTRKQNFKDAIALGRLLIEARRHPDNGHSYWMDWVEIECPFSLEMARLYVQLANAIDNDLIKFQTVWNLGIKGALRLAYPPETKETPEEQNTRRLHERMEEIRRGRRGSPGLRPPATPRARPHNPNRDWPRPTEGQALYVKFDTTDRSIKIAYVWLPHGETRYRYIFVHRASSYFFDREPHRHEIDYNSRLGKWEHIVGLLNSFDGGEGAVNQVVLLDADRARTEILEHWLIDLFMFRVYWQRREPPDTVNKEA